MRSAERLRVMTDFHLRFETDALTAADREALKRLAVLLSPRRRGIAEEWSRRLVEARIPSRPDAPSLEQLTLVNFAFLTLVLDYLRIGDLTGLYNEFYDLNRRLVEQDLSSGDAARVSLEGLYNSARISLQVIEEHLGSERALVVAYAKLVAQLMMLVGCAYSDCREDNLRQAERALRKGEERLRRLLEATPDAMVIADDQGRIVLVNGQTERLFGYPRQDLLGQAVEMLMPARFHEQHPDHRARYFGEPSARPMGAGLELYGRRRDGSEFPIEISLSPLETEEGMLVTSAIRDLTERKRAKQLRASLHQKDVLLKELHHRVKNNLQVISSLLALQARNVRDPKALELFKESENRVRMMAIIHETLFKSPDPSLFDSEAFIRGITSNLLRSYGVSAETIRLNIDVANVAFGIDTAVPCGLIINELVSNALKHAFPAGRRGEIRVQLRADEGRGFVLRISDDGVGLPADVDVRRDTTLGWQLVSDLTEQLAGSLEVHRGDHGTAFTVTFPQQRPR
jgi:PAS domain S-box-containing protein